jgi:hypothetical protein
MPEISNVTKELFGERNFTALGLRFDRFKTLPRELGDGKKTETDVRRLIS